MELAGESLPDRQIPTLRSCGTDDIALVAGYRTEMLSGRDIRVAVNRDYASTNTVNTLFCASGVPPRQHGPADPLR